MGCYYTLCHNTYAFSLLFYKVYMKRENVGSWNSGLEKGANIRDLFCTTPKVLKLHGEYFWNIYKILGEEALEGGHLASTRVEGAPYPLGAPPASWALWWPSDAHLCLYGVFLRGKNHKQAHGTKLRRHEAEPI